LKNIDTQGSEIADKIFLKLFMKMFCQIKKEYYFCRPFAGKTIKDSLLRADPFIDIMKPNQVQEAQKAPVYWKFSFWGTEGKRESIFEKLNFLPGS